MIKYSCSILCLLAMIITLTDTSKATVTNVSIDSMTIDKTTTSPGQEITVTYIMSAEGSLPACFNMGIYLNFGSRGKQLKKWGLPASSCDQLRSGRSVQQSWSVKLPDWGEGEYEIAVVADVDKYLNDDRSDNSKRQMVKVVALQAAVLLLPTLQTFEPLQDTIEELLVTDLRQRQSMVFKWNEKHPANNSPFLQPVFFRNSEEKIFAMAAHKYGPLCFIDLAHKSIYRTDGYTEQTLYTTTSTIRDIDFDKRGRFYFSETDSRGSRIKKLKISTQATSILFSTTAETIADLTGGYWNGYFAFSPSGNFVLSIDEPGQKGSFWEYKNNTFMKRFSFNKRITGFSFVDSRTLYFTTYDNKIYMLKNYSDVSTKYSAANTSVLSDVLAIKVPKQDNCSISGKLQGGRELWPITRVYAQGPNVSWRAMPASPSRILGDGSYSIENLPKGRYRVRTDIQGDTMVGFGPQHRTINCASEINNVDFSFSR